MLLDERGDERLRLVERRRLCRDEGGSLIFEAKAVTSIRNENYEGYFRSTLRKSNEEIPKTP